MEPATSQLHLKLPERLLAELRECAEREQRSQGATARVALTAYLRDHAPERELTAAAD